MCTSSLCHWNFIEHAYTDNYMYDDGERKETEDLMDYLLNYIRSPQGMLPLGFEMVLDTVAHDDGSKSWSVRIPTVSWDMCLSHPCTRTRYYYCVDHTSRSLYWVDVYEKPEFLNRDVQGEINGSHASRRLHSFINLVILAIYMLDVIRAELIIEALYWYDSENACWMHYY